MNAENISLPFDNGHPTGAGTPKRKSGRRSWFGPGKPQRFEIAVERQVVTGEKLEEELEVLELTHFSRQPKIDFGSAKPGRTVTRHLLVKNPHDYEQQVVIEKFPSKKHFAVDLVEFVVGEEDELLLTLTWEPKEAMRCREMVIFHVDGVYRLQTFLIGQVVEPPKQKRRGTSLRGRRAAPVTSSRPLPAAPIRQVFKEKHSNVAGNGTENSRQGGKPCTSAFQEDVHNEVAVSGWGNEDYGDQRWRDRSSIQRTPMVKSQRSSENVRVNAGTNGSDAMPLERIVVEPRTPAKLFRKSPLEGFLVPTTFKAPSETFVLGEAEAESYHAVNAALDVGYGGYPQADTIASRTFIHVKDDSVVCPDVESTLPHAIGEAQREDVKRHSLDDDSLDGDRLAASLETKGSSYGRVAMDPVDIGSGVQQSRSAAATAETVFDTDEDDVPRYHPSVVAKVLVQDDPRLPDTPTRRETYVKTATRPAGEDGNKENAPLAAGGRVAPAPSYLTKDDPQLVDTPTRRATFVKDDPNILDTTPLRRITFQKDDPELPDTPLRRTTFLKKEATFANSPVIGSPGLEGDVRTNLLSVAGRLSGIYEIGEVTPGKLRRSLTYTKLNVSQTPSPRNVGSCTESPESRDEVSRESALDTDRNPEATAAYQAEECRQNEVACDERIAYTGNGYAGSGKAIPALYITEADIVEESEKRLERENRSEDPKERSQAQSRDISPSSSRYYTPLTTPYISPGASDAEDDNEDDYEDSVNYLLPGFDPVTPTPGSNNYVPGFDPTTPTPGPLIDCSLGSDPATPTPGTIRYCPGLEHATPTPDQNSVIVETRYTEVMVTERLEIEEYDEVVDYREELNADGEVISREENRCVSGITRSVTVGQELRVGEVEEYVVGDVRCDMDENEPGYHCTETEDSRYTCTEAEDSRYACTEQEDSRYACTEQEDSVEYRCVDRVEHFIISDTHTQVASPPYVMGTSQQNVPVPSYGGDSNVFSQLSDRATESGDLASTMAEDPLQAQPRGPEVNPTITEAERPHFPYSAADCEEQISLGTPHREGCTPLAAERDYLETVGFVEGTIDSQEHEPVAADEHRLDEKTRDLASIAEEDAENVSPLENTREEPWGRDREGSSRLSLVADNYGEDKCLAEDVDRATQPVVVHQDPDVASFQDKGEPAEEQEVVYTDLLQHGAEPEDLRRLLGETYVSHTDSACAPHGASVLEEEDPEARTSPPKEGLQRDDDVFLATPAPDVIIWQDHPKSPESLEPLPDQDVDFSPESLLNESYSHQEVVTRLETIKLELRNRLSSTPMSLAAQRLSIQRKVPESTECGVPARTPSPIIGRRVSNVTTVKANPSLVLLSQALCDPDSVTVADDDSRDSSSNRSKRQLFGASARRRDRGSGGNGCHGNQEEISPRNGESSTARSERSDTADRNTTTVPRKSGSSLSQVPERGRPAVPSATSRRSGRTSRSGTHSPVECVSPRDLEVKTSSGKKRPLSVDRNEASLSGERHSAADGNTKRVKCDAEEPATLPSGMRMTRTMLLRRQAAGCAAGGQGKGQENRDRTAQGARKPAKSLAQSSQAPRKPVQGTAQSSKAARKPVQGMAQSSQAARKPVQGTAQSSRDARKPTQSTMQFSQAARKPFQNTAQSSQAARKPVQNTAQSSQAARKPVQNTAQSSQAARKPVQNTAQSSQAAKKPSQGAMESSHAARKPVQNKAQSSQDARKPVQITAQSSQAARKPVQNTAQSAQGARKPVQGVAQSRLTLMKAASNSAAMPRHPLPFAAKNMYYDERWMEKQTRGFVQWLNFVLTPPEELSSGAEKRQKVDAGALAVLVEPREIKLAPSKETLSFRAYAAKRRLNRLRRSACKLYQSEAFVQVIRKVEREIELGRLVVRRDKKINADLGIKQKLLDMLLSFNPLWLRVGMETIYGEIIAMQTNMDIIALSRFVLTRLLGNPEIAQKYSHPTVPHLYKDGYDDALSQFILKKFLLLILFLDNAKKKRLIDHDPCLFCIDAEFKANRDLLLVFSRDYLSGEGDLTKHLSYLGYTVSHQQSALEEYDFAVSNLATDLRDGLRLTRVMELLTQNWTLSRDVRVPAISRLQKIHNVSVAFKALADRGVELKDARGDRLDPRDVVDGHREKTLRLLWQIIFNFQVDMILSEKQLKDEISLVKKTLIYKTELSALLGEGANEPNRRGSVEPELYSRSQRLQLLLKWTQVVCAHYNLKVENFTVSFSDGRALCLLIHHYHPTLMPLDAIAMETTLTLEGDKNQSGSSDSDDSFSANWTQTFSPSHDQTTVFESLLANERHNFKQLYEKVLELGGIPFMIKSHDMSNTIPDEKVVVTFVSYLCARLLDIRQEVRAARLIQTAWRAFWIRRQKSIRQEQNAAAVVIQRAALQFLESRRLRRRNAAATLLQTQWRALTARRRVQWLLHEKRHRREHEAARCLQGHVRAFLSRRRAGRREQAATALQAWWRGWVVREHLAQLHAVASVIQAYYRATLLARRERQAFLLAKRSAVVIQRHTRAFLATIALRRDAAATVIQKTYRTYRARRRFIQMRRSAGVVVGYLRMAVQRGQYIRMREAARVIQQWYRGVRLLDSDRRRYEETRRLVVSIQRRYRAIRSRRRATREQAAMRIQAWVRGRKARSDFVALKAAAVHLQQRRRATLQRRAAVRLYHQQRGAVLTLQAALRGHILRKEMARKHAAATIIQSHYRRVTSRRGFLEIRAAAARIQIWLRAVNRMRAERRDFRLVRARVVLVQSVARGYIQRNRLRSMRQAATRIQTCFRMHRSRKDYESKKAAAVVVQRWLRSRIQVQADRAQFLRKKAAVGIIQKRFRDYRTRKAAAVILQRWVRSCIQMKSERVRFLKIKESAVRIQRGYRDYRIRLRDAQNGAAVRIQSAWRSWKSRRTYLETRSAAIVIQKALKGTLQRRKFLRFREASTVIQNRWRATVVSRKQRQEYVTMRTAACSVQSAYRGYLARRKYQDIRAAVIQIQAATRGWILRTKVRKMEFAAKTIQKLYRARQTGKSQRKRFLALKQATIVVQAAFRKKLLRREIRRNEAAVVIQACYRGHQRRRDFQTLRSKVILIQAAFRGYRLRQKLEQMAACACVIQRRFRARREGREVRAQFTRRREAITTLQSAWRGAMGRRLAKEQRSARLIQAGYRGYRARRALRRQAAAAVVIQASFRCHRARRVLATSRAAAVTLQRGVRGWLATRRQRAEYLAVRGAAVLIQTALRGYIARGRFLRLRQAAIYVQTAYRGFQARKSFMERKRAAIVLQSRIRAFLTGRRERRHFLRLKRAATVIQSAYRGRRARMLLMKQHAAAVIVQSCFRRRRAVSIYQSQRRAAMVIQSWVRAQLTGGRQRQEYLRVRWQIVALQAAVRGHLARRQLRRQYAAAMIIQTVYRKHVTRTRFLKCRAAAVVIQSGIRAWIECRDQRAVYRNLRQSAIVIQAATRGVIARRRLAAQGQAATVIQAWYRGLTARRVFTQRRSAACAIQRRVRAWMTGRRQRQSYQDLRRSALVIQAVVRGHLLRRSLLLRHAAALVVQTCYRRHAQRSRYTAMRRAAGLIQRHIRGYLATKAQRAAYVELRGAALVVQAAYRGHVVRRDLTRQNKAAIRIQTWYKACYTKEAYLFQRHACIAIQRWYRSLVIAKAIRSSYLEKIHAAGTLQRVYRAYRSRVNTQRSSAAIRIQSRYKGWIQRRSYLKVKTAAVLIQSVVRDYQTRKVLTTSRSSVVLIQRWWRSMLLGKRIRQEYFQARYRIVLIQSAIRTHRAVQRYKKMKGGFRNLQALLRGRTTRRDLQTKTEAAVCIQTRFRAYLEGRRQREDLARSRQAAMSIQAAFRMMQIRRHTARIRAALTIQTWYKSRIQNRLYERKKGAVTTLAAAWKGRQQRRRFLELRKAAVTIQNKLRAHRMTKRDLFYYYIVRGATITLQSAFRMWKAKKTTRTLRAIRLIQSVYRMHVARARFLQTRASVVRLQSLWRARRDRHRFLSERRAAVSIQRKWRATLIAREVRAQHVALTRAVVVIQSVVRRRAACRRRVAMVTRVVRAQAVWRGVLQRRRFLKMKTAATTIQHRIRACILTARAQLEYQAKRRSAILIQSHVRGHIAKGRILRLRAARKIQSFWRMYRSRKQFHQIRDASIVIQSSYKRRLAVRNYTRLRGAAVLIQRRFRARLEGRRVRLECRRSVASAMVIQRVYRRFVRRRQEKHACAVIRIQSVVRMWLRRREFQRLRRHVTLVQACVRRRLAVKAVTEKKQSRDAALCLQRACRSYLARKTLTRLRVARAEAVERFTRVARVNMDSIVIQRAYRRHRLLQLAKTRISALVVIQRWVRSRVVRLRYVRLLQGVRTLQRAARRYLLQRQAAVVTLQAAIRGWLVRRDAQRKLGAVVKLQALWRGYRLRKTVKCKKVKAARRKVAEATLNATEDKKLCNRTRSALDYLLCCRQLSMVLDAVINLDVATRLSSRCCEWMVEEGAQAVLFKLIRGCNRSLPHMEIIKHSVNVFLNLAKYEKTRGAVYEVDFAVDTLVELLSIYREKGAIFNRTCTLLGLLVADPQRRKEVSDQPRITDKLRSIYALTQRKHKIEEKRAVTKSKMDASRSFLNLSSASFIGGNSGFGLYQGACRTTARLRPAWVVRRDSMNEIEDPMQAIGFVMANLHLSPK